VSTRAARAWRSGIDGARPPAVLGCAADVGAGPADASCTRRPDFRHARRVSLLHHPAIQSLVLPAGLTVLAMAGLAVGTGAFGRARIGFAPALALLAGLALLPGFEWPPRAAAPQVPWAVAGVLLAALLVHAVPSRRRGGRGRAADEVTADQPGRSAPAPAPVGGMALAALAIGAAGLAALAVVAGSLLLAQLAGMLASCCGAAAAWVLARPATAVAPEALAPLAVAGVLVAAALAGRIGAVPLALLALVFVLPLALARAAWPARRPRVALVAATALAAPPVALALAVALAAPPAATPGTGDPAGAPADDPYYTPRWR
jgi:hypothetical protein